MDAKARVPIGQSTALMDALEETSSVTLTVNSHTTDAGYGVENTFAKPCTILATLLTNLCLEASMFACGFTLSITLIFSYFIPGFCK